ncbi:MAG: nicotinate-nucleotide adenylyltransferase [Pseudomonadota bacterium]
MSVGYVPVPGRGIGVFLGSPLALPGQSVGLLGGSFDPPHAGHVHITRRALRRFGLDQVWWMVTPGNPLKAEGPASIERRVAACHGLMSHPKVTITDIETQLNTRYTADTLQGLRARYPGVRFVWLMGADNLVSFHRWDEWRTIMRSVPMGILSRPGEQIAAGLSPTARIFATSRVPKHAARGLARMQAPAWCLVPGPMVEMSSTQLRATGAWQR